MIEMYRSELLGEAIRLAEGFLSEGLFRDCSFNPEKFAAVIAHPSVFYAFYKGADDGYQGFFIGTLTDQFFGDDLIGIDMGVYIEPEHRGKMGAVRLIQAFESWAKENGAKEIYLSQTSGVNIDKTSAFYERLGYELSGFTSKKRI